MTTTKVIWTQMMIGFESRFGPTQYFFYNVNGVRVAVIEVGYDFEFKKNKMVKTYCWLNAKVQVAWAKRIKTRYASLEQAKLEVEAFIDAAFVAGGRDVRKFVLRIDFSTPKIVAAQEHQVQKTAAAQAAANLRQIELQKKIEQEKAYQARIAEKQIQKKGKYGKGMRLNKTKTDEGMELRVGEYVDARGYLFRKNEVGKYQYISKKRLQEEGRL